MTDAAASRLPKRPLAWAFAFFGVAALVYALVIIRTLLLFGFLAVLLAVALSYPVDWLARRMPRGIAVLLTLAVFLGGMVAATAAAAPVVVRQLQELGVRLTEATQRIEHWLWHSETVTGLPHGHEIASSVQGRVAGTLAEAAAKLLPAAVSAASLAAGFVLLLALAFFLVAEPGAHRRGIQALVPPEHRLAYDELVERLRHATRRYVGGIVVSMTIMGILTAVGLRIAGIDGWAALGLLTFLGTFVPYVGAIVSAIPGLAVGLAQSPQKFLYAAVVYACVHLLEGYIVEPIIMKHAVTLRPAVLLLWQLVMAALFGVLGIVVAAPSLACVQVAIDYFYTGRRGASATP